MRFISRDRDSAKDEASEWHPPFSCEPQLSRHPKCSPITAGKGVIATRAQVLLFRFPRSKEFSDIATKFMHKVMNAASRRAAINFNNNKKFSLRFLISTSQRGLLPPKHAWDVQCQTVWPWNVFLLNNWLLVQFSGGKTCNFVGSYLNQDIVSQTDGQVSMLIYLRSLWS